MARIVLVHGAFSGAWCWEPVLPGLREAGHVVETFDLPGQGSDPTPVEQVDLDAYARRTCEVLAAGEPAVLVGHSMGGMVITQAAARTPGDVVGLVYLAAFVPGDGQSLLELTHYPEAAGDQVQANLVVEGDPPVATMPVEAIKPALGACCTEAQLAWLTEHTASQPVAPFTQPFRLDPDDAEAFAALPRASITCRRDRAIPPAMQRRMFTEAGCDPVIEIDTDHSAWISATAEVVGAIDRLARQAAVASG
jgi:pimeloyl-ACP methyl ester carboxylesterase